MTMSRRQWLLGATGAAVAAGGAAAWPVLGRGGTVEATASRALPVETDAALPARADVVVIGAGIIGITTALNLAERGLSVVVCEKGVVAGEQSSRAFGWITNHELPPDILPLSNLSKQLWQGLNARLGVDTSYRRNGLLQLCATDEEVEAEKAWIEAARGVAPVDARLISGAELAQRVPGGLTRPWKAALYQGSDGGVDPPVATSMIARVARARGVRIVAGCAVRSLDTQGGQLSGVVTEQGRIATTRAVLAGGSWTRLLAQHAGVAVPLLGVNLSMQRVGGVSGPEGCAGVFETGWRREVDGHYSIGAGVLTGPVTLDSFKLLPDFWPVASTMGDRFNLSFTRDFFRSLAVPSRWRDDEVSPFERARIVSPTPDHALLDGALAKLKAEVPAFRSAQVVERWGGALHVAPDFNPILDHVATLPGLFIGSGFSFGLTMGPAAGQVLAELVTGATPSVDLAPFRLTRFNA